jgi:intein/homing endonuclease
LAKGAGRYGDMHRISNAEVAEIMGIITGDGCISITKRYNELAICGDITEEKSYYDRRVAPLFNKHIAIPATGKSVCPKEYPKLGVYGIITFDNRIVDYLLNLGLEPSPKIRNGVPGNLLDSSEEIKKAYAKGVFDTDGSIFFRKNYSSKNSLHKYPRIKIESTSKQLIDGLKGMCTGFGFKVMDRKPYMGKRDKNPKFGFEIYRKGDIARWLSEIGFENQKHTTKIQIWRRFGFCPPNTKLKERNRMLLKVPIPCDT